MHEDGDQRNPPTVLEYRVRRLEEDVAEVRETQLEQGRKIDDIPGFITRKFDEQSRQIAAGGKSKRDEQRSYINLLLTAIAAFAAAAGTIAAAFHK
jgi:hypothetical protein